MRKIGILNLQKGYYAYTGSALGNGANNLKRRVERHLKKKKPKHWHIDFLATSKDAEVNAVVAAETHTNKECHINHLIKKIEGTTTPIIGFGASDCKQNCKSHLVYCGEQDVQNKIADAYTHLFEKSQVLNMPLKGLVQNQGRKRNTRAHITTI